MDTWPAARWKIALTTDGVQRWVEPDIPFALIGAHACCAARIDEKRVPPFAYLACCFADSIEVWPVRPIAFARWGVVDPHHELLVGQTRVSLIHQSHPDWPTASGGEPPIEPPAGPPPNGLLAKPLPEITLQWSGKPRRKPLARRVTIVGQDHPSTLRMYGLGMHRCDHALVTTGPTISLIDLVPPPGVTLADLIKPLLPDSPPILRGKVSVRFGKAGRDVVGRPEQAGDERREAAVVGRPVPGQEQAGDGRREAGDAGQAREEAAGGKGEEHSEEAGRRPEDRPAYDVDEAVVGRPVPGRQEENVASGKNEVEEPPEVAQRRPEDRPAYEEKPEEESDDPLDWMAKPVRERVKVIPEAAIPSLGETALGGEPTTQKTVGRPVPSRDQAGDGRREAGDAGQAREEAAGGKGEEHSKEAGRQAGDRPAYERATSGHEPTSKTAAASPPAASKLTRPRAAPAAKPVSSDADGFSSALTDRLIAIEQQKSWHRRIAIQVASTATFLAVAIVLGWLVLTKLLPLMGG